jgi:hypothetical protein
MLLQGLWIGMLSGVAVQTIALTIISLSTNWENLVKFRSLHLFNLPLHIFLSSLQNLVVVDRKLSKLHVIL